MPLIDRKRNRRLLLPGPVLLGFGDVFDRSFGDPKTPKPYPKVTPSRIGDVLLPFVCPHCSTVKSAVIDPKTRLGYWDRDRGFSWCPSCQGRYIIESKGQPLAKPLPANATHAPALVERNGETETLALPENGFDVLGAD